jgi:hypothetical protein
MHGASIMTCRMTAELVFGDAEVFAHNPVQRRSATRLNVENNVNTVSFAKRCSSCIPRSRENRHPRPKIPARKGGIIHKAQMQGTFV